MGRNRGCVSGSRRSYRTDRKSKTVANETASSFLIGRIELRRGVPHKRCNESSRTYDKLNRLQNIFAQAYGAAGLTPLTFNYAYNAANQRTRASLGDGSYWVYRYDALG